MKKTNYLGELDRWLDELVDKFYVSIMDDQKYMGDPGGFDAFKKAIKAKVLESYRNGQRSRARREAEPPSQKK